MIGMEDLEDPLYVHREWQLHRTLARPPSSYSAIEPTTT